MVFRLSLSSWKIAEIHSMTWLTCSMRDYQSRVQFSCMDWQHCFLKGTAALPGLKIRGTLVERFLAQNSQRLVTMFCSSDWGCCWHVLPSGFPFLFALFDFSDTTSNAHVSTPLQALQSNVRSGSFICFDLPLFAVFDDQHILTSIGVVGDFDMIKTAITMIGSWLCCVCCRVGRILNLWHT